MCKKLLLVCKTLLILIKPQQLCQKQVIKLVLK
ncbi:Uncharacterised protein [Klebsiella pneumoniae]|nr:Uncharacterised protein [Klebsiella pneumoniae]